MTVTAILAVDHAGRGIITSNASDETWRSYGTAIVTAGSAGQIQLHTPQGNYIPSDQNAYCIINADTAHSLLVKDMGGATIGTLAAAGAVSSWAEFYWTSTTGWKPLRWNGSCLT